MRIAVLRETYPGERRVALLPANVATLQKAGAEVWLERGAGEEAGFPDADYVARGGRMLERRDAVRSADVVLQVRTLGANPVQGQGDLELFRPGQIVVGLSDPLGNPQALNQLAGAGVSLLALEMIPRITRAQSMDVLSSQATIAGYRAVLLAAVELPKMFPMMTTAAGTLMAARVLILGAGVAGLQAIATARKLGAVASGYDVRPVCREQIESLGGKFVELKIETGGTEDKGGYAKAMDETFYQRQRELLGEVVGQSDVVISTALIPGRRSPLLVTAAAVARMRPGSVIVDLAAERGGNCELTKPDQRVNVNSVTILGPTNLAAEVPCHASQMFGNNVTKLLLHLMRNGKVALNLDDEIIRETMVTRDGQVTHERVRELLGLGPVAFE